METMLVWVLIVSSWNSTKNMAEMMGPFADQKSCQVVQATEPLKNFSSQCVQVTMPTTAFVGGKR